MPDYRHTAVLVLVSYGAIILSFMAGGLWGQAVSEARAGARPLVASNALALTGWAALYCAVAGAPVLALMGLALAFIACWGCERLWLPQSYGYRWLRSVLTWVVTACLVAVIAILVVTEGV